MSCIIEQENSDVRAFAQRTSCFIVSVQNVKAYLRRGTARESLLRYKEAAKGKNLDFTQFNVHFLCDELQLLVYKCDSFLGHRF